MYLYHLCAQVILVQKHLLLESVLSHFHKVLGDFLSLRLAFSLSLNCLVYNL